MPQRPVLRWLLRVLGDDAFLPIYLRPDAEPLEQTFRRELELIFWSLPAGPEHPSDARRTAWEVLDGVIDKIEDAQSTRPSPVIVAFYQGLVNYLRSQLDTDDNAHLARFWAWPELVHGREPARATGYHEIHVHFRGAIPFDHLWSRMMTEARVRNVLVHKTCTLGTWVRTRTELVEHAAALRRRLGGKPGKIDEPGLRRYHQRSLGLHAVQYFALYTNLRRFLLHQRGRTGLVSFTKSFDQISKISKGHGRVHSDRETVRAILDRFERAGAVTVELRPTLDSSRIELQRKLKNVVLGYFDYLAGTRAERPITMGIVPSLWKQEALGVEREIHGRSSDHGLRERLDEQQRVWGRQVESLLAVIEEVPALRLLVVGLDAAGLEQGTPIRAFARAFARIQQYHQDYNLTWAAPGRGLDVQPWWSVLRRAPRSGPRELWEQLNDGRAPWPPRIPRCRLGLTIHAGEDFADPTTGLRAIWEAIEHVRLGFGDRIGHGIAASLDWDDVTKRGRLRTLLDRRARSSASAGVQHADDGRGAWRVRLHKPLGVHALDLAWSDQILGAPSGPRRGRPATALATSHAVGTLPMHQAVHESLTNGAFPASVMLPGVCFVDHGALEPEYCGWIEIDDAWCARFERLRQAVITQVRQTGVVIESCPTSNCAVANLSDPPVFGLLEIQPKIRCAVATDDPGVLAAWPEHELARLDEPRHAALGYRARVLRENAGASFIRVP